MLHLIVLQVVDVVEAAGVEQHRRRNRFAAFLVAEFQIMPEWIDACGGDVRVRREIFAHAEVQRRKAALAPAALVEMHQRIDARGLHVRIDCKVDREVEERIRIAALVPAARRIMRVGIDIAFQTSWLCD